MADQEAPTPEPDEDVLTFEEFKQQKLQEQEASQRPADAHNGGHSTRKSYLTIHTVCVLTFAFGAPPLLWVFAIL